MTLDQAARTTQSELERLREAFDLSFAQPARAEQAAQRDFCLVEAGGRLLALSTLDLAGIQRATRVFSVASTDDRVRGVAGIGSQLAAVFSIPRLLGIPGAADQGPTVFFATMRHGAELIAFRIDRAVRFARVTAEECFAQDDGSILVRLDGELYPVVEPRDLLARVLEGQG